MRIPIKALKEFAEKYRLSHVVVFAQDSNGKHQNVATFGKSINDCAEASDFGNKIKEVLGWPEKLKAEPNRVKKLLDKIKKLETEIKALKDIYRERSE